MSIEDKVGWQAWLVVMIFALTFTACQKEPEAPLGALVVDSVLSEDGLMIHYDVRGAGDKILVFVHCWCCDRTFWDAQVDVFDDRYRIVTVDLGGHGESGTGRTTWSMFGFGSDVATVVKKLDLNNVIMIGHSMGGPVIIEAARRLPGRVVALIGVDNLQSLSQGFTEEQVGGFLAKFAADFSGYTDRFVRNMFPQDSDTALVNRVVHTMSSATPEMGISAMGETLAYDYHSALAEVRLPIRTISSDHYPTDVEGNAAIAASFATKTMADQGHFLHMADPVTFNRLLQETLNEFWPEPGTE